MSYVKVSSKCNKIVAVYVDKTTMLRSIRPFCFTIRGEKQIDIEIRENGMRTILLTCRNGIDVDKIYAELTVLERLLHIFDGKFIRLEEISIEGDECKEIYETYCGQLKAQRLSYFNSNMLFSLSKDRIINYEEVLSEDLFFQWEKIIDELGIANQVYLYATSNCGWTQDVLCAFLVELSESLVEAAMKRNVRLHILPEEKNKPTVKICLRTLIYEYGKVIFDRELQFGIEKILECMVNLRVNIMHIKIHQKTPQFDGKEACLYLIKLSYLYRVTILHFLGVEENKYIERLKANLDYVNNWNGIQVNLFARLNNKN